MTEFSKGKIIKGMVVTFALTTFFMTIQMLITSRKKSWTQRLGFELLFHDNNTIEPVLFGKPDSLADLDLRGIIWPRSISDSSDRILSQLEFMDNYADLIVTNSTKLVVLVGKFRFRFLIKPGQRRNLTAGCPVNQCIISMRDEDIKSADALLIGQMNAKEIQKYLPKPSKQIWIVFSQESPRMHDFDYELLKGQVNWTLTYRSESTIVQKYQYFYPLTKAGHDDSDAWRDHDAWRHNKVWHHRNAMRQQFSPIIDPRRNDVRTRTLLVNYAKNKTKQVAWMVSNCYRATSNRREYAAELSKYIAVDIYGKDPACSNLRCPPSNRSEDCRMWLGQRYKFYLAFENSKCRHYITEKFFLNALSSNMIPVVLGAPAQDYAAIAPPHSYIHVDHFESPQHLAEYLHKLDNNDTLYNSYFAWKGRWKMIYQRHWCRLCMMLHLRDRVNYVNVYEDFGQWWNSACSNSWKNGTASRKIT